MLERLTNVRKDEGYRVLFKKIIKYLYNQFFRIYLPKKNYPCYNGVIVGSEKNRPRSFEQSLKKMAFTERIIKNNTPNTEDLDSYEDPFIKELKENILPGEIVVEVGGGLGVGTVISAKAVGNEGKVISYEGSKERFSIIKKTLDLNDVYGRCEVYNTIVGKNVRVRGTTAQSEVIPPQDLPLCDVLKLDCEGAEIEILNSLQKPRPPKIIVETHGFLGASTETVKNNLIGMGYKVLSCNVVNDDKDIYVISAFNASNEGCLNQEG